MTDVAVDNETPPRDLSKIILRGTLAIFTSGLLIRGLNFVYAIVIARMLGEVGLGKYATIAALVGMFGVFFELGLAQYVERSVAQDPSRARHLFWNLIALRMILSVIGIISISGLAVALGYESDMAFGVFLFTLTFALASVQMPLLAILSANERFGAVGMMEVIGQLTNVLVGITLLLMGMGYYALISTGFVAMPMEILFAVWAIRRYNLGPLPFQIDVKSWGSFIRASIPFGITALALNFNYQADTVILQQFHQVGEVGWYNSAYRLILAMVSVAGAFLAVMTPALAREHVANPESVQRWVRATVRGTALPAMPIAMGGCLLATPIVTLLYGEAFAPAGAALAILAWDVPLVLFLAMAGNIASAVGLERPASRIFLFSALLNVVFNLIFIPLFGMIGAAAITIVTDLIIIAWFYRLLAAPMELRQTWSYLARVGLATGVMGLAIWLLLPLNLPVLLMIVAGALVYAALAFPLQLVDRELVQKLLAGVRPSRETAG
jgi:O-antigen/teichoic acid export membrane protein